MTRANDTQARDFRGLPFPTKKCTTSNKAVRTHNRRLFRLSRPPRPLNFTIALHVILYEKIQNSFSCVSWAIVVIDNPCDTTHTLDICYYVCLLRLYKISLSLVARVYALCAMMMSEFSSHGNRVQRTYEKFSSQRLMTSNCAFNIIFTHGKMLLALTSLYERASDMLV